MTTTTHLSGKKIIFFGPKTFGYEIEIIREMEKMGAEVTFRSVRPIEHKWAIAFLRIFPKLGSFLSDIFYFSWLKRSAPIKCDIILVIKAEGLSPNFLLALHARYNKARYILYLWDSVSNCAQIETKLKNFDDFYSFDKEDCKNFPQFKYRPLFFLDKYLNLENETLNNGLLFVGTLNGDRSSVISKISHKLQQGIRFEYFLFVRSRIELAIRKLTDGSIRELSQNRLIFTAIPSQKLLILMKSSAAILDIENPNQTGLTMRTFEVLALGKKLITTNKQIVLEDFYDPKRILVIDRFDPVIQKDFFQSPALSVPKEFVERYSLNSWLCEILGLGNV